MKVKQYMDTNFVRVSTHTKMTEIARIFSETYQPIVIVEEAGTYFGVISVDSLIDSLLPPSLDMFDNFDFIRDFGALENEFLNKQKINIFVAEDLTNINFPFLRPDDSVLKAAVLMHHRHLRALPVIDNKAVTGIISRNTICEVIINISQNEGQ